MKSKFIVSAMVLLLLAGNLIAQYTFNDEIRLPALPVESQGKTGTCWSFATTSFLESELIRLGKGEVDLSEIYSVRMTYVDKAQNYILRQGQANFSQGSLAHDVLSAIASSGIMPQESYSGLHDIDKNHNHSELEAATKGFLDGVLKARKPGKNWKNAFDGILDAYLTPVPESFTYKGEKYEPESFARELAIISQDYLSVTSFSHHPYNESFILEIPDNYSNGSFLNLELDRMMEVVNHALEKGYTMSWDGDVGEKGFNQNKGIALLPLEDEIDSLFFTTVSEIEVSQEDRQDNFESFSTTDDHLMHLIGRATDQDGRDFYIIKNSWGDRGPYHGYLYMSDAYFRMKTISVTLHKDGMPK